MQRAAVDLRNLPCDVQSEPEVTLGGGVVLILCVTVKRVKDAVQGRSLDNGPAVFHLKANFCSRAREHHAHRRVGRPVLECIQNEIAEQLLKPPAVADPSVEEA